MSTSTTPTRPVPTAEELAVKHEVPGYPGLYVKRTRNGGASLHTRWLRRLDTESMGTVVGGIGPYLNRHDPYGYNAYDDAVEAVIDNVDHWFGWPRLHPDDVEKARTWREEQA